MQRGEKKLRALLNALSEMQSKKKETKDKNIIIIIALNGSKNYGTGWHTYMHMYDMCLHVQVILVTSRACVRNLSIVGNWAWLTKTYSVQKNKLRFYENILNWSS